MLQPLKELELFYSNEDPWGYETNSDDVKRRNIILSEIPERNYENVLDIGCGHGFVTRELSGKKITGIDISTNAITQAKSHLTKQSKTKHIDFIQSSIFDLDSHIYELKFFESAIVGTTSIASPTHVYSNLITDGLNGYLSSSIEWTDKLVYAIDKLDDYQNVALNACNLVREKYSWENQIDNIRQVLMSN